MHQLSVELSRYAETESVRFIPSLPKSDIADGTVIEHASDTNGPRRCPSISLRSAVLAFCSCATRTLTSSGAVSNSPFSACVRSPDHGVAGGSANPPEVLA